MATDLSISLPDEPGWLAKAAKALGAAGVNVEGIAGLGGGGHATSTCWSRTRAADPRSRARGSRSRVSARPWWSTSPTRIVRASSPSSRRRSPAPVNLAACYVASRSRVVFSSDDPAALRSALGV